MSLSSGYFDNPYFSEEELKCKGNGDLVLHPGFLGALIHLREEWGRPLFVNSCCRSPEHNKEVGGAPNSYHLTEQDNPSWLGTLAIDISNRRFNPDLFDNGADVEYARDSFPIFSSDLGWSVIAYEWGFHIDMRILMGNKQYLHLS